ncbi:hypothetical protein Pcinc_003475 [Petrolisthes cinctipes]|uniref:Uncharacterized protein n=1 Tax=Petrolisthes cinctipes TaxID=88211 RepID=A0AAE1GNM0_PETCI|nr:hypothetical protein Pcinc_003475 [Petrolisthes cinctipes]
MDHRQRIRCAALAVVFSLLDDEENEERAARIWTRPCLSRRKEESVYYRLVRELSLEDPQTLNQWIRLNKTQYHHLLDLVTPLIKKKTTRMREPVSPSERLMITLRYLATDIIDTENLSRGEIREGRWRRHPHGGIERLPVVARGHCTEAKQVRDNLKSYFNHEGQVHWQNRMCNLH